MKKEEEKEEKKQGGRVIRRGMRGRKRYALPHFALFSPLFLFIYLFLGFFLNRFGSWTRGTDGRVGDQLRQCQPRAPFLWQQGRAPRGDRHAHARCTSVHCQPRQKHACATCGCCGGLSVRRRWAGRTASTAKERGRKRE